MKTFAGLASLVFLLLIISQFIAYFNFSNLPTIIAVHMADFLEGADIGALWLLVGFIANIPDAPAFVRHASFSYNLSELRQTLLGIDDAFAAAASQLPILSERVTQNLSRGAEKLAATHEYGALIGLGVLVAVSCAVFFRKIRPE